MNMISKLSLRDNKENLNPNSLSELKNYANDLSRTSSKDDESSFNNTNNNILNGSSSYIKKNQTILTRLSQAEKSLNNFCQEVEQCQISMKNLLKKERSVITDNEFQFGKSPFGNITEIMGNSNYLKDDDENFRKSENAEYQGLYDLDYIKKELSFTSAYREEEDLCYNSDTKKENYKSSRPSNYSNETNAANFYFSRSMKVFENKDFSSSTKNCIEISKKKNSYSSSNIFTSNINNFESKKQNNDDQLINSEISEKDFSNDDNNSLRKSIEEKDIEVFCHQKYLKICQDLKVDNNDDKEEEIKVDLCESGEKNIIQEENIIDKNNNYIHTSENKYKSENTATLGRRTETDVKLNLQIDEILFTSKYDNNNNDEPIDKKKSEVMKSIKIVILFMMMLKLRKKKKKFQMKKIY